MKTSTKAHISTRNHWLVVIALSILILLLGTAWYSTTELASAPVRTQRDGPHLRGALFDSFEPNLLFAESRADASHGRRSTDSGRDLRGVKRGKPKSPAMPTASLAPFLHIVPSQDGHELYISASGVGIPEGEVFVNIGIGPGHREGSYTMTYSEAVQAHVATAVGFEAGEGASGPINITTTLGLDTGPVDFYRAYVPASTTQTVRSIDGNFELELVSTDTITFETYIAVVPSYAPPGPAPLGHRFVGSTYSVRAAAALTEANRPMLLRLRYEDTFLAGADPHTLSIFAWDASREHWIDLGGRLFYDQQYVSVTTRRFTTYALMSTPAWQDDFDDFSGLDLAETNNVTLGLQEGTPGLLVLWNTPGSGTAVSKPITPTTVIDTWGSLTFTRTVEPPTTTLTVDVLSVDGTELLADVTSGASLAGIGPAQYPSLKLRANLSSTTAGETPALDAWRLTWEVKEHELFLPLVISSPVNADRPEQGQTPIPTPTVSRSAKVLSTFSSATERRPRLDSVARLIFDALPPSVHPTKLNSTGSGWQKIIVEGFEETFPPPTWGLSDSSSADGGQYYWGQRDCKPHFGDYSAWAGGGGSSGALLACGTTYANDLKTFMRYGPFDLSQATDAELQFALWTDIEGNGLNWIDRVGWGASIDGSQFVGFGTAGQTGDWVPARSLRLTNVPDLGDLTGETEVYVGWWFVSDGSNPTAYEGAFVDDVAVWVYIPPPPTPTPEPPSLPITRHTTLADFAGGRSHDGTIVEAQQGDGALALAAQVEALGAWERLPSLPRHLCYFTAVTAKGQLFIIGGSSPGMGAQRQVYSALIHDDGLLGHWVEVTQLPQALRSHAAVVANDHLFVLGGFNANGIQRTVFSTRINDDGTLGLWTTQPLLPEPLRGHAAVSAHGYIYVLGGRTSNAPLIVSDAIYRASIHANGILGDWETLPSELPLPSQWHAAVATCGHLYLIGGADTTHERNHVFQAEIHADGSLGAWSGRPPLSRTLIAHAAAAIRGGILVAGGWNSRDTVFSSQRSVYWASLGPGCSLGSWVEVMPLPYGTDSHTMAVTDRYVYNLGGGNAAGWTFATVLMTPLQLDNSLVQQGTFNHQFYLGNSYTIEALRWTEEGSGDTEISLRYRVATAGAGEYGPWSGYTSTNPVTINAVGGYLEYQLKFEGGSGLNDKRVGEVSLRLRALPSLYLPLVVKN